MEKTYQEAENNRGELKLEFTQEEFKEAMQKAFNRNRSRFSIPGFRKGKANMKIVLSYYGEGILYDEAIQYLVNPAFAEAVQENDLAVVSQPEIDVDEIGLDKGLKATVSFDLEPEVELGDYKGVEAVKPDATVTDEAVEEELKRVQDRNSRLIPVEDRAAEEGDTVNIDYAGYKDGKAFDGGTAENYDLELGSGTFIPGFEEKIVGHEEDEDFEIDLTFPEDYGAKDLAGEDVTFKVHINSVKTKELPELDDDFAMDVSEYDTFEEYKNSIKDDLEAQAEKSAQQTFENNVLEAVTDNIEVDIPQSMIENEIEHLYQHQDQYWQQYGLSMDDYLHMTQQSKEDYKELLRPQAEKQVKVYLTIKAVIEAEDLELTDEDKKKAISSLAEDTGLSEEQVAEQIKGNVNVENSLLQEKAIRFLADNATAIAPEEAEDEEDDEATEEE